MLAKRTSRLSGKAHGLLVYLIMICETAISADRENGALIRDAYCLT
jgi:hypothetical protein